MAHIAAVDKEEIVPSLLSGRLRLSHKARDITKRGLHLHRQQILNILPPIDIGNALAQAGRLEVLEFCPIVVKDEVNVGIDEHNALKGLKDIAEFRSVGLEELTTGRDIVEQIIHLETAAHGTGSRLMGYHPRGGYLEARTYLIVSQTRE
jgi:hypothetical protein